MPVVRLIVTPSQPEKDSLSLNACLISSVLDQSKTKRPFVASNHCLGRNARASMMTVLDCSDFGSELIVPKSPLVAPSMELKVVHVDGAYIVASPLSTFFSSC